MGEGRAWLLLRWPSLVAGGVVVGVFVDGPVGEAGLLLAYGAALLGAGAWLKGLEVADDLRAMRRYVRDVERVNRRIVQRASERRKA